MNMPDPLPRMRGVNIVNDPKTAEKLVDPMRRTILSMLANHPMTESGLAKTLGLTESAIGYHLKTLEAIGLVRVVKREPEPHGILQKFYGASAMVFIIDTNHLPQEISRYFFPINLERIRGFLCGLPADKLDAVKDDRTVERLATEFVDHLIAAGNAYKDEARLGREELNIKLYREAFGKMLEKEPLNSNQVPPPSST
jgi:DNA-binding transcriptional ArsR family regulator